MERKGRARHPGGDSNGARRKPESRARGERNGWAKLTGDQIAEIRRRCDGGEFQARVAKDFGISQAHVSRIVLGMCWREQRRA